jgi:hypothetical protein
MFSSLLYIFYFLLRNLQTKNSTVFALLDNRDLTRILPSHKTVSREGVSGQFVSAAA